MHLGIEEVTERERLRRESDSLIKVIENNDKAIFLFF